MHIPDMRVWLEIRRGVNVNKRGAAWTSETNPAQFTITGGPPMLSPMADVTPAPASDVGFRVCIHRGTSRSAAPASSWPGGSRILLDLGLPLDAGDTDPATLLPDVPGLLAPDPGLLALVVSHSHADHWGLVPYAAPGLRVVTGAATRRIMGAAAAFVPRAVAFAEGDEGRMDLVDRQTIQIGPFAITPYLVDHSAYDAYAMLIEAGGRRLFYSADIRGHGRKAALFERLLATRRFQSTPC